MAGARNKSQNIQWSPVFRDILRTLGCNKLVFDLLLPSIVSNQLANSDFRPLTLTSGNHWICLIWTVCLLSR